MPPKKKFNKIKLIKKLSRKTKISGRGGAHKKKEKTIDNILSIKMLFPNLFFKLIKTLILNLSG